MKTEWMCGENGMMCGENGMMCGMCGENNGMMFGGAPREREALTTESTQYKSRWTEDCGLIGCVIGGGRRTCAKKWS